MPPVTRLPSGVLLAALLLPLALSCSRGSPKAVEKSAGPDPQSPARDSNAARLNRADSYFLAGRYAEAMAEYDAVLQQSPSPREAHEALAGRGVVHVQRQAYAEAVADFSEALRLHPEAAVYVLRAEAYSKLADWARVRADCDEALRLDPTNARAFLYRGLSHAAERDFDGALADYAEAIRLRPGDAAAHLNRAVCYENKGLYGRAAESYREGVRLAPDESAHHRGLAWLLATCREADVRDGSAAVRHDGRACELSGWRDGWDLEALAAAYAEGGQFEKAVELQKKVLALPDLRKGLREVARERLAAYEQGRPWRE